MADWASRYLTALDVRDERESKHKKYIDAYTRLADRDITTLSNVSPSTPQAPGSTSPPSTIRLHTDLSSTHKTLESQLSTLTSTHDTLIATHNSLKTSHATLQRTAQSLERRLKDREEELKEKRRLVENVQDEMVGLNLELNVMGREMERLRGENADLVRRWVVRMGTEVEEMNKKHAWG